MLAVVGCGEDTFDLLPPADAEPEAEAGAPAGGRGGASGSGGRPPGSGRGGTSGLPLPTPDCPPDEPECRPCNSIWDCEPGETCDTLRDYCAEYCDEDVECPNPARPVCHMGRRVCVECFFPSDCGVAARTTCDRGACVQVECLSYVDCRDPAEPVCEFNMCRPCRNDAECGTYVCREGRCLPPPQPGPD